MVKIGRLLKNNGALIIQSGTIDYIVNKPNYDFLHLTDSELLNIRATSNPSEIIACVNATDKLHVTVYGNTETLAKLSFPNHGKSYGTNNNGNYIRIYKI
jgi:hypothetical protein